MSKKKMERRAFKYLNRAMRLYDRAPPQHMPFSQNAS